MKAEILRLSDLVEIGGYRKKGWIFRFWEKVRKAGPNECWIWTGKPAKTGYGQLNISRWPYLAHRLSYLLAFGELSEGKEVMHTCDVPLCVNPKHLVLDTHRANMLDAAVKGILKHGQDHPFARFTTEQISEIRKRAFQGIDTYEEIAEEFGTSKDYVSNIVRWKRRRLA